MSPSMQLCIMLVLSIISNIVQESNASVFRLQIQLIEYSNPNGWTSGQYCCDGLMSQTTECPFAPCETQFVVCIQQQHTMGRVCPWPELSVATGYAGGDAITFGGTVGTIANPIIFESDTILSDGIQLYIESEDDDILSGPDVLDQYYIEIPSGVGIDSPAQTYVGSHNVATLRLSYSLTCTNANYYGQNCDIFCRPQDNENGHYNCNASTGAKECLPGYYNPETNCISTTVASSSITATSTTRMDSTTAIGRPPAPETSSTITASISSTATTTTSSISITSSSLSTSSSSSIASSSSLIARIASSSSSIASSSSLIASSSSLIASSSSSIASSSSLIASSSSSHSLAMHTTTMNPGGSTDTPSTSASRADQPSGTVAATAAPAAANQSLAVIMSVIAVIVSLVIMLATLLSIAALIIVMRRRQAADKSIAPDLKRNDPIDNHYHTIEKIPCKNLKNIDNPIYHDQTETSAPPTLSAIEAHYEMASSIQTSQQIIDSGRYEVITEHPSKSSNQEYGELYATPLDGINVGDTLDIQVRAISSGTTDKPKVSLKKLSDMLLRKKIQEDYETPVDALPQNYEKPTVSSDAEEDAEGYVVHNCLYSNDGKRDIYSSISIKESSTEETPETSPVTTRTSHFLRPKQQSLAVPQANHDELYMSMHAPGEDQPIQVAAASNAKHSGRDKRTMSDYDLPWKKKI